nr:retrotransposon protein, putative, Ty1-copia subclass [Tanacetum cinerariifolium]
MEDNVSILDQVHEFLILVSKFKNLNIEIPEKLLVGAIITKLPSSWHNYRKKLMHTSEDFTLDQIQEHLRIEEETHIREKNLNGALSSKVVCYKCGEKGHIKRYCKNPKKKNQNSHKKDESANAVEQVDTTEITAMVSELNIGMIQELHMASVTTTDDWWYDSENQRGKKIQILRSDRGGAYFSTEFSSYCESQGLIHQRTAPYTPQQNGVAERKNRVLQDIINAMLISAYLPKNLWGEALLTACHVRDKKYNKVQCVRECELSCKRIRFEKGLSDEGLSSVVVKKGDEDGN